MEPYNVRQGIRLMFFKGTYQTTSLGNSQGEIYSGDGNRLSNSCALIGYWNPENFSGIGTIYENSVSGQNDLELKNGIEQTYQSSIYDQ